MRRTAAIACAVMLSCLGVLPGSIVIVVIAMAPAAAQQTDLNAILRRSNELHAAGNYPAALVEAQKLEAAVKARFGEKHAIYAMALINLAHVYQSQSNYGEAEGLYRRALTITEKALGENHPDVAMALNNLAAVYSQQGKYAEAEGLFKRALAIREKVLGTDHPRVAQTRENLATLYAAQGKYADAERLYKRTLAVKEKALGANHPDVAMALNNLAAVYSQQGKYAEAEGLFKRALSIREEALGQDHPDVADTLHGLAILYEAQGKYADAEGLYKRALTIKEKSLGADHPDVALILDNLAILYKDQGKYADAERLHKRALAIREKTLGADHEAVAASLDNLANVYFKQGRDAETEGLRKRALAIYEKALGADHPDVAKTLNNLAELYRMQGKYAEAEGLSTRALAIKEKALGGSHRSVAASLYSLAGLYAAQGKYAEAQGVAERALAIYEKALGQDHPDVADTLHGMANVYALQAKYAEAEGLQKRALAIYGKALGVSHPDVATTLFDLAKMEADAHDIKSALDHAREATVAVLAHAATEGPSAGQKSESTGLVAQRAGYFLRHVAYLDAAVQEGIQPLPAATREAFEIAQWANHSSTAAAVQQMGLRFAAGTDALAALVRERQDLAAFWRGRDKALLAALSQPQGQQNPGAIDALRRELAETESKQTANTARLEREFPEYAALASPKPLQAEEVQQLLGADEALVFFLTGDEESYVFALTRDGFDWKGIPLGAEALAQKVAAFRRGLDVDALHRGLERVECTQAAADKRGLSRVECGQVLAKECEEAEKRGLARPDCATAQGRRELFDLGLAHELYGTLLGPVEPLIKDKRHLIVVPSGALTALPFHLLVTENPAPAAPGDLATYRIAAWLLKRHAVSVLPSAASLKALRVFAHKDEAKSPLIGFGDPVFNAEEESKPGAEQRAAVATRSYSEFWKGVDIDRSQLSQALPRLPETADELRAVAKNLGAPSNSIHLRADASESTVKHAALSDYRVVYFATHGLVAGEIKGLAEPSLALTLPKQPSDMDDGLLTASEVAQLKLNADWVVLSACNTIAGDKPGAEALSGLARAFFYAGARALLVSHWAVESNAAMRLTTSTFDILKSDPSLGRAEALRRSMLAYMNDATNPLNAYPALWAPFVVVGEGAGQPAAATR